jgi:hypothetical protein
MGRQQKTMKEAVHKKEQKRKSPLLDAILRQIQPPSFLKSSFPDTHFIM